MKILSAPQQICFGITNKCNLSCKHCLASGTAGSREFSRDMLRTIIHQIRDMKIFNVAVFGGEPLASEHFHFVIEEFEKYPIALSLNTNATLIDSEEADWLARTRLNAFCISLDGGSAAVHDGFRGRGSFDAAVRGITQIQRIKKNIVLSATLTKVNCRDIENIVALARDMGITNVRFNNVCYVGTAACFSDELLMTPAETFAALETIRSLKEKYGPLITGSVLQQAEIIDALKKAPPKLTFPLAVNPCGAAVTQCAIRPDGKVVPCEIIWDFPAGDLYEESLAEIWKNSPVMNQFRIPCAVQAEDIPECVDCRYLRLCYLGHRCQPYYYPGRFMNKKLFCINESVFYAS